MTEYEAGESAPYMRAGSFWWCENGHRIRLFQGDVFPACGKCDSRVWSTLPGGRPTITDREKGARIVIEELLRQIDYDTPDLLNPAVRKFAEDWLAGKPIVLGPPPEDER